MDCSQHPQGNSAHALKVTSGYLSVILEHISEGVLFLTPAGVITTYNHAAQKIMGLPARNVLGHRFWDVFEDLKFGISMHQVIEQEHPIEPRVLIWADGTDDRKTLNVEGMFLRVCTGEMEFPSQEEPCPVQGLLLLLRDVTHLERLQRQIAHTEQLRELGVLVAHLAHELRNPLQTIQGFTALLQSELAPGNDRLEHIVRATRDLNTILSQVLDYARYTELHIEMVDLSDLLKELTEEFNPLARTQNVKICLQHPHRSFAPVLGALRGDKHSVFAHSARTGPRMDFSW